VTLDAGGAAMAVAEGVQVVARASAWRGSPSYLPSYVTPFHLLVVNGSPLPVRYDYGDLVLFDEARFQYTAMPPADVAQLLRWSGTAPDVGLADADAATLPLHRRRPLFWDPWWDPWWWGPPYAPYPPPPRVDDVLTQALPMGTLQPGAQIQGFVYFPRLRPEASGLTFEFHYRLGDAPRVLTLPFAVQRAEDGASARTPA
jgi:hypothetical protein